jgi:hypothetical protein
MTEKRYININSNNKKSKKALIAKQLGAKKSKYHNKYYFKNTNDEIEKLFNKYGEVKKIYLDYTTQSSIVDENANGIFYNKSFKKPYIFNDKTKETIDMMKLINSKNNYLNGLKIYFIPTDILNNKLKKYKLNEDNKYYIEKINMLFKKNNIFSPKLFKTNIEIMKNTLLNYNLEYEEYDDFEEKRRKCNELYFLRKDIETTIIFKNRVLEEILPTYQKKQFKKDVQKELIEKVWHPKRFNYWKNYDDIFIELEEQ